MVRKLRTYVPARWHPLGTQRHYESLRPPVGAVIAYARGVWRVLGVEDVELDEKDRKALAAWREYRQDRPWPRMPFRMEVEFLGGVAPKGMDAEKDRHASMTVRSWHEHPTWEVYPHDRWPQCSCCGEPMPCRAALVDLQVDASMERMSDLAAKLPGCCWGCGEPVTRRHRSVCYSGENLDLPGGPEVVFHTRMSCHHLAEKYELRWLAADPARRRIVTYPGCGGTLVWHEDGSSECLGGEPGCLGFLSHDHGIQAECRYTEGGCARGCDPERSRCNPGRARRPDHRDPDLPQGLPERPPESVERPDSRPACPGVLIVHEDGGRECVRGGLHDCWDGSKYRHATRRECRSLSHGCPRCETAEGLA